MPKKQTLDLGSGRTLHVRQAGVPASGVDNAVAIASITCCMAYSVQIFEAPFHTLGPRLH